MNPNSQLADKPLVWIIDDDLVSLFAARYGIEQGNPKCRVVDFDSGEVALKVYSDCIQDGKRLPDIILLDLVMPNMSGWDFLDELKTISSKSSKTAIYILSAFTSSKDLQRAKEHPAIQGYFEKPVSKYNIEKIFQVEPH
ncbi:response regulator [Pareuzebyella sediminis]|uniref:response regulator n=1 Tax=Pareuzebyella sediminis TaxID=2607998 RepID=UPI0011EBB670|nr:response regulator [Pareuzebyella sediminis]